MYCLLIYPLGLGLLLMLLLCVADLGCWLLELLFWDDLVGFPRVILWADGVTVLLCVGCGLFRVALCLRFCTYLLLTCDRNLVYCVGFRCSAYFCILVDGLLSFEVICGCFPGVGW